MPAPRCLELKVLENKPCGQSCFALRLEHPGWEAWLPGQFVMIRPVSWRDLTWARPFSICRLEQNGLLLFYQAVGRGTLRLSNARPGEIMTVWGPLGTGFAVSSEPTLLLAGGIGIAPFVGYADALEDAGNLSLFFGHRLPLDVYPMPLFKPGLAKDDFQDRTRADLEILRAKITERMQSCADDGGLVLACGPMPFLRMVWQNALSMRVRTQLSLERRMACGVGACLGCVTVTTKSWADKEIAGLPVPTCTCGPVFWAEDIDLDAKLSA